MEMAAFDEDGDMVTIANTPVTEKPHPDSGTAIAIHPNMTLVLDTTENITITVDVVNEKEIQQAIENHDKNEEAHEKEFNSKYDIDKEKQYLGGVDFESYDDLESGFKRVQSGTALNPPRTPHNGSVMTVINHTHKYQIAIHYIGGQIKFQ